MEKKALKLFYILVMFVTGLLMACGVDDEEDGIDLFIVVPNDGSDVWVNGNDTIKTGEPPYITTNPTSLTYDGKEAIKSTFILTNCKYMKLRKYKKPDWYDGTIKIYSVGQYKNMIMEIKVKENDTGQERSNTIVLEGYNDNTDDAKVLASYAAKITQYPVQH